MPQNADSNSDRATTGTVLLVGLNRSLQHQVASSLGHDFSLLPFEDIDAVAQALLHDPAHCLIALVSSDLQTKPTTELCSLRERFPGTPLIALFDPDSSSPDALIAVSRPGVSIAVPVGSLKRDTRLRVAMERCKQVNVTAQVWRFLDGAIPVPAEFLFRRALHISNRARRLGDLATAAGMGERALRKYCAKHSLMSPQWILGWSRVLTAAFYLGDPGRTIQSVARLLHFPSSCALQHQLNRYSSLPTRQLRRVGPLSHLVGRLRHAGGGSSAVSRNSTVDLRRSRASQPPYVDLR